MAKDILSCLSKQSVPGRHIKYSVPAKTLCKMGHDLRKLITAVEKGGVMPSRQRLIDYFADTYGVVVTPNTITGWLSKTRNGQPIA
jgi:hypothetical protein